MNPAGSCKPRGLDLADIQGNIVRAYGRFGFPYSRHIFFNIGAPGAGRRFIERTRRIVTTAERWTDADPGSGGASPRRPLVAVNIGLSYRGLVALELPTRTLRSLPEEFIDGMAKRSSILGDVGCSAPENWDPIWTAQAAQRAREVHLWVSLSAQADPKGAAVGALAQMTGAMLAIAQSCGGVALLEGHRGNDPRFQDAAARMRELAGGIKVPIPKEHFDFTDGIADPVFLGQYEPEREAFEVIGSGKFAPGSPQWEPLATGEFILGHASEAQELPPMALPWSLMRNGSFMAYRKLHQNVATFHGYVRQQAQLFQKVTGETSQEAADATIRAKMVGRWPNGFPLAIAPTYADCMALQSKWAAIASIQLKTSSDRTPEEKRQLLDFARFLTDFRYVQDIDGAKCPLSAHIRRANPRDAVDPLLGAAQGAPAPGSTLSNRRRILRRGLPYGSSDAPHDDDQSEHGVIFMALCASLFGQFEFVQQQWMQYGASFNVGNDTDTIVGSRSPNSKFVIPSGPASHGRTFICANLPQFVETRGGEYFFLPSLTALRQIAEGSVDPT